MTTAAGRGQRIWIGLTDLAFLLTSAPLRPSRIKTLGLAGIAAPWLERGGSLRVAGPRWHAVWGHDTDRMARLDTVVLPAPWIGLSEAEMAALLARLLQVLMPDFGDHPFPSAALARAETRLQLANMSGG